MSAARPGSDTDLLARLTSLAAAANEAVFVDDFPRLLELARELIERARASSDTEGGAVAVAEASRLRIDLQSAVHIMVAIDDLERETGLEDAASRLAHLDEALRHLRLVRFCSVYGARLEVLRGEVSDALEARAALDVLASAIAPHDLRPKLDVARRRVQHLSVSNPWAPHLETRLRQLDPGTAGLRPPGHFEG